MELDRGAGWMGKSNTASNSAAVAGKCVSPHAARITPLPELFGSGIPFPDLPPPARPTPLPDRWVKPEVFPLVSEWG